jgi:hypothetical protein
MIVFIGAVTIRLAAISTVLFSETTSSTLVTATAIWARCRRVALPFLRLTFGHSFHLRQWCTVKETRTGIRDAENLSTGEKLRNICLRYEVSRSESGIRELGLIRQDCSVARLENSHDVRGTIFDTSLIVDEVTSYLNNRQRRRPR